MPKRKIMPSKQELGEFAPYLDRRGFVLFLTLTYYTTGNQRVSGVISKDARKKTDLSITPQLCEWFAEEMSDFRFAEIYIDSFQGRSPDRSVRDYRLQHPEAQGRRSDLRGSRAGVPRGRAYDLM